MAVQMNMNVYCFTDTVKRNHILKCCHNFFIKFIFQLFCIYCLPPLVVVSVFGAIGDLNARGEQHRLQQCSYKSPKSVAEFVGQLRNYKK